MRKKTIEHLLFFSTLPAVALVLYASDNRPTAPVSVPDFFYYEFPAYNNAILNLSSGYAISVLFYALIVYLPEHFKRKRIRNYALIAYSNFRESVLTQILFASGKSVGEELEELLDPEKFDEYWRYDETGSGMRYYEFLNGLNDYFAGKIAFELEILRDEIQFILNAVDVDDEEAFTHLRYVTVLAYDMSKTGSNYEDQKRWGRFLWVLLVPKDTKTGKIKKDPIIESLEKI